MPGSRSPRPLRTLRFRRFLALMALATLGAWWATDQPRRKDKAIATTRRVGGVLHHEREAPDASAPKGKAGSSSWLAERLSEGLAHGLSVVNLDGAETQEFEGIVAAWVAVSDRLERLAPLTVTWRFVPNPELMFVLAVIPVMKPASTPSPHARAAIVKATDANRNFIGSPSFEFAQAGSRNPNEFD